MMAWDVVCRTNILRGHDAFHSVFTHLHACQVCFFSGSVIHNPYLTTCCIIQADKDKKIFYTLRTCRADAKLVGKREAAAKKKAQDEAEKKKASV